jgi:hypothetical protein
MASLYAQTSGSLSTTSGEFTAIPGLAITLPRAVDVMSLVILNLPNPYATGSDYPGAVLGITIDGVLSPVQASFTYSSQQPESSGRMPTTLVVGVPLIDQLQQVQAVWFAVRGSTVNLDSPATLTAVIGGG